jgi:hypothetical protein
MIRVSACAWLAVVIATVGCAHKAVRQENARRAARAEPPDAGMLPPVRPARNVLVLSGGGMYGAYTAGFLAGWTKAGTRPPFDVVTGISTGSLIACAAFLGPAYDQEARRFYTSVKASDIYSARSWVLIPWADALASSKPLRKLIASVIDDDFLKATAAEHRAGRRLYVGTTHLGTRKLVVWDMGAIAARGDGGLFRDVLLASCSVPGMLPPVKLPAHAGGKDGDWHVDGGVTAPLFVPPGLITSGPDGKPSNTNLYVLVAGKLFPDPGPVRPRVLDVLSASATGVVYAHCRSEVASLFHQMKATGGDFHLTALPDSDGGEVLGLAFDPREMTRLYEVGFYHGVGGPVWMTAPPFESTAADPPRD